jgi:hypothetical protein
MNMLELKIIVSAIEGTADRAEHWERLGLEYRSSELFRELTRQILAALDAELTDREAPTTGAQEGETH